MAQSKVSTLEGKEIADDYVRTSLPKGRWADTWDIFKSCFGKLVIINVLTLIFFVPGIALVYIRSAYVSQMGVLYPFASNILGTYPVTPDMQGAAERIVLSADLLFYSLLIVAGFIAAVGLAGGAYSVRKLINTHGQFTVKGYFHGVKVCYLNTVLPVVVGGRIVDVIADPPVHVGVADGIRRVVAEKTGQIGYGLLPLLLGLDLRQPLQIVLEKSVHMVFVHVGAYVPIVPVPQDRDIVEKNIRPLEAQLIKPAVFGNHVL